MIWDFQKLLIDNFDGDIGIFDKVSNMFLSNYENLYLELERQIQTENYITGAQAAHRIKGTALMFAFDPLVSSLNELEGLLKESNSIASRTKLLAVQSSIKDLISHLKAARKSSGLSI